MYVDTEPAVEEVGAGAADQDVLALAAEQRVVALAADEDVVARAAVRGEQDGAGLQAPRDDDVPAPERLDGQLVGRLGAADVDRRGQAGSRDDAAGGPADVDDVVAVAA